MAGNGVFFPFSSGSANAQLLCLIYRWDYIFSFIKKRRADRSAILPDRKDVTMTVPFMDAYVRLLIQTCHKLSFSLT